MMRTLLAMSLIAFTLSCAHKDAGKGRTKFSGRKADTGAPVTHRSQDPSFDSTFYIGYVDYFPDTREFYTTLYYREGHEYPDDELLQSKLDSVIVFNDDWGRERLPIEAARQILVLSGLDSISIYDRTHRLVCKSRLTRVEYLWDGMESYFIAVFKADGRSFEQTGELYGVSSNFASFDPTTFFEVEIKDKVLDDFLIKKLGFDRSLEWDMRHYKTSPAETTYSVISSYSIASDEALSYLTAFRNNKVEILNEEVNNFHYLNILPVPVMINGKPLLLISAGYPSSDVMWDYLAAFDGATYEAIDYNRVHLKTIAKDHQALVSR